MAKSRTKAPVKKHQDKTAAQKSSQSAGLNKLREDSFFDKYQNYIFIGIIVFAIMLFFREGLFGGKIFASPDNLSPFSFKTFLEEAKAMGIYPLWVPYIFGGMPSLGSLIAGIPSVHNFFSYIWDSILTGIAGDNMFLLTVPYYFLYGISLYLYTRYKFKNNLTALFCALMGVLATGIIQLIIVGHHTKMMTFAFFPLILLLIDRLIDSDYKNKFRLLINFALLAIIIFIQLHFHHIQMLFYSYLMIGLYFLYTLIYKFIKKENYLHIVKALAIFAAATILAVAMDADIIMSVKEYNKYSIRGQAGIETVSQNPTQAEGAPLSYEYATNWSFSPGEVMTFILPYYYGFGDVEVQGQRQNMYWGQMPFTDSPVYFGVITLLLAIIGIVFNFKRNVSVQALAFIAFFFLVLSFGRNLSILYDFFYNYVPFFSSFRAPVMIHYYMDLAIVILAGFGLKSIIEYFKESITQDKLKKTSFVIFAISGLMLIISVIGFENSYKESVMTGPKASEYRQQGANPQQISQYFSQVSVVAYENLISDLRLHAFLIAIVGLLIYLYSQKKVSVNILAFGIMLIGVFDLWNISSHTLHWDPKTNKDSMFAKSDYVNWLLTNNPNTHEYRIALIERGNLSTSNFLAYYKLHQFNGYQGAKIRNYQDAIDIAGGNNPLLLGLANVKYIITDQPLPDSTLRPVFRGSRLIYENPMAMQRAFFADEYKVKPGLEILRDMKNMAFDPRKTAYLEKDINVKIDKPDSATATAKISKFDIHNITYDVNATGNNLLVLSEIYYPAGWKAFIDGKETEIYKTDYLFRSIVVPAGKHTVEFKFHPETYYTGKAISTTANILVALALLGGIGGLYMGKKKKDEPEEKKHEQEQEKA